MRASDRAELDAARALAIEVGGTSAARALAGGMGGIGPDGELIHPGSEEGGDTDYDRLVEAVRRQIFQLRVVLEAAEAKEKERAWLRNQNQGELDVSIVFLCWRWCWCVDGVSLEWGER